MNDIENSDYEHFYFCHCEILASESGSSMDFWHEYFKHIVKILVSFTKFDWVKITVYLIKDLLSF